jgi:hypothetical protein
MEGTIEIESEFRRETVFTVRRASASPPISAG